MNSHQRRKARRALGREFGVHVPPDHIVLAEFAGADYETHVSPFGAICEPKTIRYKISVVPIR